MKMIFRKILVLLGVLLTTLFLLLLTYVFVLLPYGNFRAKQEGNRVVALVEKYKLEHGRLPATLNDIGLEDKMDAPIQYIPKDESDYLVSFSDFGVGESVTYSSKTKKWNNEDK